MCQWAQALAICCLAVASQKQQFPKLSVSYWYLGVAWLTTLHRQRVSIFFSFLLSGRLIVQDRTIFMVSINTETTITAQGICQEYTGSRALGKAWYPRHVSLIIIIFSTWFCHYFGVWLQIDLRCWTKPISVQLSQDAAEGILNRRIWMLTITLIKATIQEWAFCFEQYLFKYLFKKIFV